MPTVTIGENSTNTFSGLQDTRLQETNPTTNYETNSNLNATSWASGDRHHIVIRTPGISNITGPVTVNSATLHLYENAGSGSNTIDVHQLIVSAVLTEATWNNRTTADAWTAAGAFGTSDANLTALATQTGLTSSAYNTWTSAALADYFEGLINGTITVDGLLLLQNPDTAYDNRTNEFDSSNVADGTRPFITIDYTAGGGGPAVSTVSSNSASEGSNIVHTVTLSGATSGTTNFAATLAGGTATGGGTDYTSDLASASYSNGVTFSAGNMVVPTAVSSWTVTIPTTSDIVVEGPETYTLTVGGVSGTGTINDLVVFTVNSVDLGSFTGFATFTITASATSGIDRDVNYATTDGTAANGVDYTAVSGTATILAGNLTADFLVPIINTRKPDTDLVTTGWTVTGAADHSAALADNTDTSYTTSPDVTASPGPLKTQMLPTPLAAGTHSRQIRANYTSTPCDVKMSLLNSSDVVQGDSGWVSLTASIADYTLSITTTGSSTRFLFEVRATP